eukprot:355182-Chlamydomonas_euryale.AAC.5
MNPPYPHRSVGHTAAGAPAPQYVRAHSRAPAARARDPYRRAALGCARARSRICFYQAFLQASCEAGRPPRVGLQRWREDDCSFSSRQPTAAAPCSHTRRHYGGGGSVTRRDATPARLRARRQAGRQAGARSSSCGDARTHGRTAVRRSFIRGRQHGGRGCGGCAGSQ